MKWGVVVAAGGLVKDPLATSLGTPRKALAMVQGRSCLARTLDAVSGFRTSDCVVVSGEDVQSQVHHGRLVLEGDSQIENAKRAVEALGMVDAVLFLPADTPLLSAEMLDHFASEVERRASSERWLAAGVTTLGEFKEILPRSPVQPVNLKDGSFLSGALYAASPSAFFHAISLLGEMSQSRKNQFAMIVKLGVWSVVRYLLHRVTVEEAEQRLGKAFDAQAIIVTGCHPLSAADIDDVADYDEIRIYASLHKDDERL